MLENKKGNIVNVSSTNGIDSYYVESLDYDACAEIVKKFLSSKHPTRAMVVELIDRVEIDNDKNVNVFFRFQELSSYVR